MWIPAKRLLDRHKQPPSRREAVAEVSRRLRDEARATAGADEASSASRLKELRTRLAAEFGEVSSCGGCARAYPRPAGAFAGGACCATATERVFSDDEVSALARAGTRPRHLRLPRGEHAGCAFRAPAGCTLNPAHRPNLCVRYVCVELSRELYARGRLELVEGLSDELEDTFQRFAALRAARRERELLAEIHPDLAG